MIALEHDPSVIPARRVGALVRAARSRAGLSVRAAARQLGVSRATVQAWEHGARRVEDEHLQALAALYGVTVEALAPARRGVDLDLEHGKMRVGDRVEVLHTADPTPDDILARYLSVLYELRGARPTDPIPLRDDDLNALADALGNKPSAVEARLVELMGVTREEATRIRRIILRRRVLTPAAGLVLGAGMLGGFAKLSGSPAAPPATSARPQASAGSTTSAGPATTATGTSAPATSTSATPAPTTVPPAAVPAPPPVTRAPAARPRVAPGPSPEPTAPVVDAPGTSQLHVGDGGSPSTATAPPTADTTPPTTPPSAPEINVDAPGAGQITAPGDAG